VVRGGIFGAASCLLGVEEHGEGKQLVLYRVTPILRRRGLIGSAGFALLGMVALQSGSSAAFIALMAAALAVIVRAGFESGAAASALNETLESDKQLLENIKLVRADA
jgi:hypothetical protein